MVHNHGPEEGAGLACNELRLPNDALMGACMIENYQEILARCFVAMSEVDYDLQQWQQSTRREI